MRLRSLVVIVVSALAISQPAAAQDTSQWEPLGPVPVDEAGAGRRGYAVAVESASVLAPGASEISLHMVAANDFYREDTGLFAISERDETHTAAVAYRRGFKVGRLPRFELGGQLQLNERDAGFLNGFISGFESLVTALTGSSSAKNRLRTDGATAPPTGTIISDGSRLLYRSGGDDTGIGDVSLIAKTVLREGDSISRDTRVAARLVVNIAGQSSFSEGNFAGAGVSISRGLLPRIVFHGDVHTTVALDRTSRWDVPLKRMSFGFSAGPELALGRATSVSLQYEGNTTPYLQTGTAAFDEAYGDITLGFAHRFRMPQHVVVAHVYARENMNMPFSIRWNTDPDLAVGIKLTVRR